MIQYTFNSKICDYLYNGFNKVCSFVLLCIIAEKFSYGTRYAPIINNECSKNVAITKAKCIIRTIFSLIYVPGLMDFIYEYIS